MFPCILSLESHGEHILHEAKAGNHPSLLQCIGFTPGVVVILFVCQLFVLFICHGLQQVNVAVFSKHPCHNWSIVPSQNIVHKIIGDFYLLSCFGFDVIRFVLHIHFFFIQAIIIDVSIWSTSLLSIPQNRYIPLNGYGSCSDCSNTVDVGNKKTLGAGGD